MNQLFFFSWTPFLQFYNRDVGHMQEWQWYVCEVWVSRLWGQNCTKPPFNGNFGIFLGWHWSFGMDPKLRPSQSFPIVDDDTCVGFESRGFGDLSRLVNLFLHWTVGAAAGVGEDRPKAPELQKQWLWIIGHYYPTLHSIVCFTEESRPSNGIGKLTWCLNMLYISTNNAHNTPKTSIKASKISIAPKIIVKRLLD